MVRHGLMVVGAAFSGKSSIIKVLQKAMSTIPDDPNFVNTITSHINPKSITSNQLYGTMDHDSGEWKDGVLALAIQNAAESLTPDRKWIIFDGPVDAVWIENMNTVLDDNKKLCLTSGQIIKLKPTMTIMFEVEDLQYASPATVSRCGMVLLEPIHIGYNVLIVSYFNFLKEFLDDKLCKNLNNMVNYICDMTIQFTTKFKFPVQTGPNFLVNNMLHVFDSYLKSFQKYEEAAEGEAQ